MPQVGVITNTDFPRKLKCPAGEHWCLPGWMIYDFIEVDPSLGYLYHIPIFVSETTTYIRIGVKVTTPKVGKLARLGIYAWNDGVPGALILDAGTVSVATTGVKEIIISQELTRGYYFLSIVCNDLPGLMAVDVALPYVPPVEAFGYAIDEIYYLILTTGGRIGDVAGGLQDPAPTIEARGYEEIVVFLREA